MIILHSRIKKEHNINLNFALAFFARNGVLFTCNSASNHILCENKKQVGYLLTHLKLWVASFLSFHCCYFEVCAGLRNVYCPNGLHCMRVDIKCIIALPCIHLDPFVTLDKFN